MKTITTLILLLTASVSFAKTISCNPSASSYSESAIPLTIEIEEGRRTLAHGTFKWLDSTFAVEGVKMRGNQTILELRDPRYSAVAMLQNGATPLRAMRRSFNMIFVLGSDIPSIYSYNCK